MVKHVPRANENGELPWTHLGYGHVGWESDTTIAWEEKDLRVEEEGALPRPSIFVALATLRRSCFACYEHRAMTSSTKDRSDNRRANAPRAHFSMNVPNQ